MTSSLVSPLLVPLSLAALLLLGCHDADEPRRDAEATRRPQVRVERLEPGIWKESIRTAGVFEAAEEVALNLDFTATVRRVSFQEGGVVEAGQVLLELDRGERELLLDGAARNVENLEAQLERARRTLARSEELFALDAVARQDYERAATEVASLSAQYREAVAGRRLAQRKLSDTTLRSPVSGRVARRQVEPGETVMAGQVLGLVQTVDTLRVVTFVSEKDINALRVGAAARVTTPGVRGAVYPAYIESLGVRADPRTGNFTVRLTVANERGLLRPGMTAQIELQGLEYDDVLLIPASATVDRQRRRVVYTVVDDRAVEVEPVLAATLDERLPVIEGLAAGDVLIVEGLEAIVDGSPVEVLAESGT